MPCSVLTAVGHKLGVLLHMEIISFIVVVVSATPGLLLKQHRAYYMLLTACAQAINESPEISLGEASMLGRCLSSKLFNSS